MRKITGVAAIIKNDESKILIAKRTEKDEQAPNLWSLPCGSVEENETPEESIIREMQEELGIGIKIEKTVSKRTYENEKESWSVYGYLCKITKGQPSIKEPEECEEIKFVETKEIPENFFPELRTVVKDYEKTLKTV
ncbi:MAG: NUDIX domain-containing protein [Candidatus Micrarchaeota archaeon]